jgi:dienelactone hydrolase
VFLILLSLMSAASAAEPEYEQLAFQSTDNAHTSITGLLFRPAGQGPFGAVVGIHGCNGLFEKDGSPVEQYVSWGRILREAGYVVLLLDGLGSRGIPSLCGGYRGPISVREDREIVSDAYGALLYLQNRGDVRPSAVAVLGWSFGGEAVLWTISTTSESRPANLPNGDFKAAVAFYPGCPESQKARSWNPVTPLLLQVGAADNYTPPKTCVDMIEQARGRGADVEMDLYPGAFHLFDHPNMPAHPFRGVVFRNGSSPMIGTDPAGRAAAIDRVKAFLRARLN